MRRRQIVGTVVLLGVWACAEDSAPVPDEVYGDGQVARSGGGMVVAAQPLAAEAGAQMLRRGGNAADAAVAAAFAVSVVEPSMNSIGGRTQILLRLPDGTVAGIDATTQAPSTYDPVTAPQASYGYPTVGVPGAVAGLTRLLREYGTLPLAEVMAPAIELAGRGFRLLPGEAARHAAGAAQLAEFDGSRTHFLTQSGESRKAGDLFLQPYLAATLTAIAGGGADAFYRGPIAERIVADMAAHGGAVTAESLAQYRALRRPGRARELPRPRTGGYGYPGLGRGDHRDPPHPRALRHGCPRHGQLGGTGRHGRRTGVRGARGRPFGRGARPCLHDPEGLGGRDRGDHRRTRSGPQGGRRNRGPGHRGDEPAGLTRPRPGRGLRPIGTRVPWGPADSHTTHLSAADADGMYVSLTQTIGPNLGSRVATPGLGFLHAATLGGYLGRMEPGERARSSISPLMVLRDGEPVLVLGAAGGARIISAVVQAVLRVVDQGMSLPDALAAARVHPVDGGIAMETSPGIGWTADDVAEVQSWGMVVQEVEREGAFGRIHGIWVDPATGDVVGVADPDWEGAAVAVEVTGR